MSEALRFVIRLATPADIDLVRGLPRWEAAEAEGGEPGQLWVAEDVGAAGVCAAVRLVPEAGTVLPCPHFHLGWAVHSSTELRLHQRQRTLLLGHDLTGEAALRDFACEPAALDAMEALVRHVVGVCASGRAAQTVVFAELPGLRDAAGQSPFWSGFGRHFYGGDPEQAAEQRGGVAWRSHVAALLPRQLVYASFLPASAQAAIGRARADASALLQVLQRAGLRQRAHVRIDDAGPVLEADLGP
jgi:arginine N-succinyltransferase